MMIAGVHESPGGDYAPKHAQSVFDFNQARLNRIYFDTLESRVEIETHLVGWLVTYSSLINQAKITGKTRVEDIIIVSGDKFEGVAVSELSVFLRLFDINTLDVVEKNLEWKEAMDIHCTVLQYIKRSLFEFGTNPENIVDLQLILIQ